MREPETERLSGEALAERFNGDALDARLVVLTVALLAGSSTWVVVGKGTGVPFGETVPGRELGRLFPGVGGRTGAFGGWMIGEVDLSLTGVDVPEAGAIPPPGAATSPTRAATVG